MDAIRCNVTNAIRRSNWGTIMQIAHTQNTSPNRTAGKREWCDDSSVHLRRQAAFCLRLSDFCADEVIANHLRSQAAEYHQRALWAEFHLRDNADADDPYRQVRMLRH